ncbi:MAG: glycosyltransferase family 2 protein [Methylococcaceae bacterium]|nr:glycosyltransferase family 2 protein [Methylococcaceae bacterium]
MPSHSLNLPKVAAAIVTYNHRDPVLKLIASLEQQKIPTFVTENKGADGAAEAIRSQFPQVSLLASSANLGGCGGFNCAALAALSSGCEYLIFIDDDAFPEADCIAQLTDFLDAHPDYIFAAPSIYISSQPDTLQEAGGGVNFSRSNPIEAWYRFQDNPDLPPVLDIDYASACCLMVRADALREMGVLDWAYFIFSDDVDLCLRLRKTFNKKGACLTGAKAFHDFPWAKPFAPMRLYFFQRNGLRLIANHQQGKGELKSLFIALMRLHRRIFYSALIGDDEIKQTLTSAFKDAWRGHFGNWSSWVVFAKDRMQLDAHFFAQHAIKRILIDITIEDFEPAILQSLKTLQSTATIDILCDEHRVTEHQANKNYTQVFARKVGFIKPLHILPRLLQQKYDLVITDANMEARRPSAMCGKHAAIFHNDALYLAPSRPYIAAIAHLVSLPIGLLAAFLTINHFRNPFPAGTPPDEAADLLNTIGIDPKIGQPYARLKPND